MNEMLKPCPFCGGEAAFNTTRYSEDCDTARLNGQTLFHGVNCVVCGGKMHGIVGYKTKGRAADAWNRRAESAAVEPEAAEREDGARLRALDALLWAPDTAWDGIALTPYIVSATRERRISIDSVYSGEIGDAIVDAPTLREAIDAARATHPESEASDAG